MIVKSCPDAGGTGDTGEGGASDPVRSLSDLSVDQRRVFLKGYQGDWRLDTDETRGKDAPPLEKPYPVEAKRIDLPAPGTFAVGRKAVADAIRDRRSLREYSCQAFTLEELAYLLWATQGVSWIDHDGQGKVVAQFRTVPSGGARHPFESYLVVNRVAGLGPGLYRYLPVEHRLLVIYEGVTLGAYLAAACYGQTLAEDAAVVFVWSAFPYRTEWRYGCIAHKLVAIEAGHVCENLHLAADSIGAGACAILGYNQRSLDTFIGADGIDEFVVYLAATGKAP